MKTLRDHSNEEQLIKISNKECYSKSNNWSIDPSSSICIWRDFEKKKTNKDRPSTVCEQYSPYETAENWTVCFKREVKWKLVGKTSFYVHPRKYRCVQEMILWDRRFVPKQIFEGLNILYELVHVDVNIRKISANFIPKCMKADQKGGRVEASRLICPWFEKFLSHVVTMNETWWVHF